MANEDKAPQSEVKAKKAAAPQGYKEGDKIAIKDHPAYKGLKDMSKGCQLVSRLDHPVTISYDGEALIIPPRAQGKTSIVVENEAKLGALPAGIQKLKL